MLPQQLHCSVQLGLGNGVGTGQNDSVGSFHLIIVELTEILHIHLHLAAVHYGHSESQLYFRIGYLLHGSHHVTELANAGRLDYNALRIILSDNLFQSFTKVTHQAATDAAGVHFRNINTGILQETAINADLAEFIFNKHQLLAGIGFLNHLFNKGGFTCSQETGININFRHWNRSFEIDLLYSTISRKKILPLLKKKPPSL